MFGIIAKVLAVAVMIGIMAIVIRRYNKNSRNDVNEIKGVPPMEDLKK